MKRKINPALWKTLMLMADIMVYMLSTIIGGLGLAFLIAEGKHAEAMAIGGAALVIFCKLDQLRERIDRLQEERLSQYVRKNV